MSYNTDFQSNNNELQEILNTINNLPSAGSGGGVEYEVVTLNSESTSIPYTLSRVTSTFGMYIGPTAVGTAGGMKIGAHHNNKMLYAVYEMAAHCVYCSENPFMSLDNNNFSIGGGKPFVAPYIAVFINDPNEEALVNLNG